MVTPTLVWIFLSPIYIYINAKYIIYIFWCEQSELITREQYYIDLLKPEYNILPAAGSLLGFF